MYVFWPTVVSILNPFRWWPSGVLGLQPFFKLVTSSFSLLSPECVVPSAVPWMFLDLGGISRAWPQISSGTQKLSLFRFLPISFFNFPRQFVFWFRTCSSYIER